MPKSTALFIDDLREPPNDYYDVARSSSEAIELLAKNDYEFISFDHDLGGDDTTRPVVLWIIENDYPDFKWNVHSMNPIGKEWIEGMLNRYRNPYEKLFTFN